MKQLLLMPLATAAVVMAYSCTKIEKESVQMGTPVSFIVEDPALEDENPLSKMSISNGLNSGGKYDLSWQTGDRFVIYSFPSESTGGTRWGYFTKTDTHFHGMVPNDHKGTNLFAVFSPENSFEDDDLVWRNSRYELKTNIPSMQDGTGLRYSVVGANPTCTDAYDESTGTPHSYTFDFSSATAKKFYLKSALVRIDVPQTKNVCRIDITHTTANTGNYFLVSNGDSKNFYWQGTSGTPLSSDANGSNSITIYDSGSVLPEHVFFAVFRTNSKSYGLSTLTFLFTNTEGKTATRVVRLKKSDGTLLNLSSGALNYLGEVSFDENDFQ